MHKTNALAVRRALGTVLRRLQRDGEPILVERNREPAAVLISLRDFEERFVDKIAAGERERLARDILAMRARARPARRKAVDLVRELRGRLP
jgi:prevent-host-death family protein